MLLDPQTQKLLEACIRKGNKIEAIRIVRSKTGTDLDTAVVIYEKFYLEMLAIHPEIADAPALPNPLPVNPEAIKKLKIVKNKATKSLETILRQINQCLIGWNYEVHLDVHVIDLKGRSFQFAEIIRKCHPESNPKVGCYKAIATANAQSLVNEMLGYEGDTGAGVDLRGKKAVLLKQTLIPNMWSEINKFVQLEKADTYDYRYADPDIFTAIFWGFSFLFHDNEKGICLLLSGASSD